MAYFPNRTKEFEGRMNAFWQEPAKKDVMGYRLTNVKDGDFIPDGTPIMTNETDKTAVVCRYAYVVGVATDNKTLTVKNAGLLSVGMRMSVNGAAAVSEIASISGETVVLKAAVAGIKAGDILVEGTVAEGAFVPAAIPNRITLGNKKVDELDMTIAATHEAWVLQNVVHYPDCYLNKTIAPGTIYLVGCLGLKFMIQ